MSGKTELNWEVFNPDCMEIPDLLQWRDLFEGPSFAQEARRLWPELSEQEGIRAAALLGIYCRNKARAMRLRRSGIINTAITLENVCDEMYESLPQPLKW